MFDFLKPVVKSVGKAAKRSAREIVKFAQNNGGYIIDGIAAVGASAFAAVLCDKFGEDAVEIKHAHDAELANNVTVETSETSEE